VAKRAYRYNKETKQMEEVTPSASIPHGRFDDNFVSPVDGSVITGQRSLHEHNMRNGVKQISAEDHYNWEKAAERRKDFLSGDRLGRADRIEAIKHALDVHTRRRM
jgi:hypothetical protein